MNTIDCAMKISRTKAQFIRNMEKKGYAVKWTDTRKNITYTCPNTMNRKRRHTANAGKLPPLVGRVE